MEEQRLRLQTLKREYIRSEEDAKKAMTAQHKASQDQIQNPWRQTKLS